MIFPLALSAAESLAGSERGLVLVTRDRELLRAAEASGVQVLNPEASAEAQQDRIWIGGRPPWSPLSRQLLRQLAGLGCEFNRFAGVGFIE